MTHIDIAPPPPPPPSFCGPALPHTPTPACACPTAGVLAADNEGALLGRGLLETTVEGARQLSSTALAAVGRFFATEPGEP